MTIIGTPKNIERFIAEAFIDYDVEEHGERLDTFVPKLIVFDLIDRMPPELRNTVSPHETVATQEEADRLNAEYNAKPFSKMLRGDGPEQAKYLTEAEVSRRLAEYGAVDWYSWSVEHYGTKWGAYSHSYFNHRTFIYDFGDSKGEVYGRVDIVFQTAWSQPTPIFKTIENRWDLTVYALTQDEGGAPNVTYGDDVHDYMTEIRTVQFDAWDTEEISEGASA